MYQFAGLDSPMAANANLIAKRIHRGWSMNIPALKYETVIDGHAQRHAE
jgi:hypothetical protein